MFEEIDVSNKDLGDGFIDLVGETHSLIHTYLMAGTELLKHDSRIEGQGEWSYHEVFEFVEVYHVVHH